MALTPVKTLTSYTSGETNIHQATGANGEGLVITLINESGAAGSITGLSESTTSVTQNPAGNLLPGGFPIADKGVITIKGVVMTTDFEYLVLNATVALTCNVAGWSLT